MSDEKKSWGPWIRALMSTGIIALLNVSIYCCKNSPEFFKSSFTAEDGLIEWATVIGLLYCAGFGLRKVYQKRGPIFWSGWSLLCLTGAGEEISWGQRLWNVPSPAFFLTNNIQRETNFHNLRISDFEGLHTPLELALLTLLSAYFILVPLIHLLPVRKSLKRLYRPHWDLVLLTFFTLSFLAFLPCYRKREIAELVFTVLVGVLLTWPKKPQIPKV